MVDKKRIGKISALVVLGMFAMLMLAQPIASVTVNPTNIVMGDDEWIGFAVDTKARIYFDETPTPNEIEIMNARVGIRDQTPDALLDFDFESISNTAGTEYGSYFTTSDTGGVTTGTDTTYGTYNAITRTGANGGTINTYGEYIDLDTDGAGIMGTHTAYGLYVDLDGNADNNYAAIFTGGNVGIGTASPNTPLHVLTDDAGANVDLFTFDRTTASPADDDSYDIIFNHENDNDQQEDFAQLTLIAEDVSDGTEGGLLKFSVADGVDGSMDEAMRIGKGDGTTDVDITFITLRNSSGTLCYIYPNAAGNGIVVTTTHP